MYEAISLGASAQVDQVSYEFHWDSSPADPAVVRSVRIHERLSEPYRCRVGLVVDPSLDISLGRRGTLTIRRPGVGDRVVQGIVSRIQDQGPSPEGQRVRVELVPALWTLGQRVDYRIFQDQDVPSIVESVLREAGMYNGCARTWRLRRTYARRGYCVQFGESDLAFITRLMDEEGIAYIFEQDNDCERLVLVDEPGAISRDATAVIPRVERQGVSAHREVLWSCVRTESMRPTTVSVEDYDSDHPAAVDGVRTSYPRMLGPRVVRECPGRFVDVGASPGAIRSLGQTRARRGFEREQSLGTMVRGQGDVTSLTVGARIAVEDTTAPNGRIELVVVSVDHKGRGGDHGAYENSFSAIPADSAGWPRQAAKRPRMHGPQTAVVVSTTGDEVDVDAQRRVLVRFRWDLREGVAEPTCRVRVAQASAGNGWGTVFIPRRGMEVVVQFLDGDPDRPLVTGCVYNGENIPPHDAASEATKTSIRTSSVPGGYRHHELTFDDAREHPGVYLHAAGEMQTTVDGTMFENVGSHFSQTVVGNSLRMVRGEDLHDVTGGCDIHAIQGVTLESGPALDDNAPEGSMPSLYVGEGGERVNRLAVGMSSIRQVDEEMEVRVRDSSIKMTGRCITLSTGGAKIVLDGDRVIIMGKTVEIESGEGMQVRAQGEFNLHGLPVLINC